MYPRPWSIPPRVTKKYENHLRVVFLCVSALDPKPPPNRHLKGRSQMSVNPTNRVTQFITQSRFMRLSH